MEITKKGDTGECDCFDGNLSDSIVSENDHIKEYQGRTPTGASNSVKPPRDETDSNTRDRPSPFVLAIGLCAFCALASLYLLAMNFEYSQAWMRELWHEASPGGRIAPKRMLESGVSTTQLQVRACQSFFLHHQQGTGCFLEHITDKYHVSQLKFREFFANESAALFWSGTRKWFFEKTDTFQIRWTATYCACQTYASIEKIKAALSRAYKCLLSSRHWRLPRLLEGSNGNLDVSVVQGMRRLLRDADAKFLSAGTSVARQFSVVCSIQISACHLFVLKRTRDTGCFLENIYMSITRQYQLAQDIHGEEPNRFFGEFYVDDHIQDTTTRANDMDRQAPTGVTIQQSDTIVLPDDGDMFELQTWLGSKVEPVIAAISATQGDINRGNHDSGNSRLRFANSYVDNFEPVPEEKLQVTAVAYTDGMCSADTDFNDLLNRRANRDFPTSAQKEEREQKALLEAKVFELDYMCWSEELAILAAAEVRAHRSVEGEILLMSVANTDDFQLQPEMLDNTVKSCELQPEISYKETDSKEYNPQQQSPKVQVSTDDAAINPEFPKPRRCFTGRCRARQQLSSLQRAAGDE